MRKYILTLSLLLLGCGDPLEKSQIEPVFNEWANRMRLENPVLGSCWMYSRRGICDVAFDGKQGREIKKIACNIEACWMVDDDGPY